MRIHTQEAEETVLPRLPKAPISFCLQGGLAESPVCSCTLGQVTLGPVLSVLGSGQSPSLAAEGAAHAETVGLWGLPSQFLACLPREQREAERHRSGENVGSSLLPMSLLQMQETWSVGPSGKDFRLPQLLGAPGSPLAVRRHHGPMGNLGRLECAEKAVLTSVGGLQGGAPQGLLSWSLVV